MDLFAEIENKKKEKRDKKKKDKKSKDKKVKPLAASNLENTSPSNEAQNNNNDPDLTKNLEKTLKIDQPDDEEWLDDIGEDENAMTTSISRISKMEVAKKTKIVTKSVKQEDGTQKDEEVEIEVDENGKALNEQFDWANAESMTSSMVEKAKEEKLQPSVVEEKKPMKLSDGIPSATTGGSFMDRMKSGRTGANSSTTTAPMRRRRQQQYKTEDANQFPTLGSAAQQEKGTPAGFTSVDTNRSGSGGFGARMRDKMRMETSNKFGNLG